MRTGDDDRVGPAAGPVSEMFSDSRVSDTVDVVTVIVTCRPAAASASMNSTRAAPSAELISITGTACGKVA